MKNHIHGTATPRVNSTAFQSFFIMRYLVPFIGFLGIVLFPPIITAREDTITIVDFSQLSSDRLPEDWIQVLPKKQKAYTDYSIINDSSGSGLRVRAGGTGSWIEKDLGQISVSEFPFMEWTWMVSLFPEVEWEEEKPQYDFAIRIELVYDFRGSHYNILNIIRKGLIRSIISKYPPEAVISYVWAHNVPADEPFISPENKRTVVIPVESGKSMQGKWIHEQRNIQDDFNRFIGNKRIALRKIRIMSDTDNSLTNAESGLKEIVLKRKE
ncbi:DUF3047 domain-containing protein [bacterium]|nr:DUF3047 domain-containing protein [bacterium]